MSVTNNNSHPRQIAEEQFKIASAEAAIFELRFRMLAGKTADIANKPIDTKLAVIRDAILSHYESALTIDEVDLLKKACTLRNKLLHCEFSAARNKLDQIEAKPRSGGAVKVDITGLSGSEMAAKITQVFSGHDVGQVPVDNTKTKALKDVYAWLHECQGANEFEESSTVFRKTHSILDRLSTIQ